MSALPFFGEPETKIDEESFVEQNKKANPFDVVRSVTFTKDPWPYDDSAPPSFYVVHRALSHGQDTLFQANEMNSRPHLSDKMKYDFLLNTIRKAKRYNPWVKAEMEDAEVVMEYYGYSYAKAKEALKVLPGHIIEEMKAFNISKKGGRN
jgi:hypothetical protein